MNAVGTSVGHDPADRRGLEVRLRHVAARARGAGSGRGRRRAGTARGRTAARRGRRGSRRRGRLGRARARGSGRRLGPRRSSGGRRGGGAVAARSSLARRRGSRAVRLAQPRGLGRGAQAPDARPDLHLVAVAERSPLRDALAVHERAVGRAEVLDRELTGADLDRRVPARDVRIGERDVAALAADRGARLDRVLGALAGLLLDEDELAHRRRLLGTARTPEGAGSGWSGLAWTPDASLEQLAGTAARLARRRQHGQRHLLRRQRPLDAAELARGLEVGQREDRQDDDLDQDRQHPAGPVEDASPRAPRCSGSPRAAA